MPRRYRNLLVLILLLAGASLGYPWIGNWLERHPEHNPWAPMTLDQSDGWATPAKLA